MFTARGAPWSGRHGVSLGCGLAAVRAEIVIPTLRAMAQLDLGATKRYGFKPSFNATYPVPDSPTGWWVAPYHFGIDQGPVILMVENYRTGLIWEIMRRCPYVVAGLRRAGFRGGWL
jgi:hypothetical protein